MNDPWIKLQYRLKTKSKPYPNERDRTYLLYINLFFSGKSLIGWVKPQRIPLETPLFSSEFIEQAGLQQVTTWDGVMNTLRTSINGMTLDKTLVLDKIGRPVAWLT